jgi:hypothetical protein
MNDGAVPMDRKRYRKDRLHFRRFIEFCDQVEFQSRDGDPIASPAWFPVTRRPQRDGHVLPQSERDPPRKYKISILDSHIFLPRLNDARTKIFLTRQGIKDEYVNYIPATGLLSSTVIRLTSPPSCGGT